MNLGIAISVLAAFELLVLGSSAGAQQQPSGSNIDTSLATLSVPHVHVCQHGFEALFGIPEGADPDESLIIRGARQSYFEDRRTGDEFRSTLEVAMPYERALPPGPPHGAVIAGRITCTFRERAEGGFPFVPVTVTLEEEGVTRSLSDQERALFRSNAE
ncbi:MAG: hypothetical protein ACFB0Z_15080 [Candidatus Phaeomarinobacter sp.]